jgi:hypothetical protein
MPFVRFVSSVKLDEKKRDEIRGVIWDAVTVIPGKTPEVTMIEIQDGADLMKGPGGAPAIFAETRLFTAAPTGAKEEYSKKLFEGFERITGVSPAGMYFNIMEFNAWAADGSYMTF